jgi:fructokinase
MRILSTGEVLWDIVDEKEFLGGAPLNFSANSRRLGNFVALLTGVGDDELGRKALRQMNSLGLNTDFVQVVREAPTGTAQVTLDKSGSATFQIGRPAAFDVLNVDSGLIHRCQTVLPDWIYFGTLANVHAPNEEMLHSLVDQLQPVKCFYDMNLRDGHWNLPLIERLSALATVIKLNDEEAKRIFDIKFGNLPYTLERFCECWAGAFGVQLICVTMGGAGCALYSNHSFQTFAGYSVDVVDTVGAGDAFAAGLLYGLDLGWSPQRIAFFANALGAMIASRRGATPEWTVEECYVMIDGRQNKSRRATPANANGQMMGSAKAMEGNQESGK